VTDQPSGTVTLVFTDIEGSTRLLEELGQESYRQALGEHRRIVREAFHAGYEVDYEGDAFFYAFASAQAAVSAVQEAMAGLEAGPIRIRVGVHTGEPGLDPPKYVGMDVHTAARIMSAGHGGQVLVSETTRALVTTEVTDLGPHRLKDVEEPLPLYQLGEGSFPPLKTISNTNLPRPASSFVGRGRETHEVVALVREGARILTLSGPGGTGKTRLAIEAASELVPDFKAGVYWVGLATLSDPALVSEQVGQVLGSKNGLNAHIGGRELLLVLDNLEQVMDCASELSSLVDACPKLQLLCTSRELLRVRSEVEYHVPPLGEQEAVELFCERARLEADVTIAELCRRLDNLPLAVELAAARARMLSPAQILERLAQRLDLLKGGRDVEARQQTLRATIAWSYDLLAAEEQRLFRALSVFSGGCTLEAAEEVAEADLDTLESLLDKSLLRRRDTEHGPRFAMLETIREFAAERLREAGEEEAAGDRHTAWLLDLLREVGPRWAEPAPREKLDTVLADDANVRLAVERAIEKRETDAALELVGLLGRTWLESGRFVEMRTWAQAALGLGACDSPLAGPALITLGFGSLWLDGKSFATAAEVLDRAGMRREAAYATMCLGVAEGDAGAVEHGLELLEQARSEFEQLGDAYCLSVADNNIGYIASLRWPLDPGEARQFADRARVAISQARTAGDRGDEVAALDNLSHALIDAGEVEEAWAVALQALRQMIDGQVGLYGLGTIVAAVARCASLRGEPERALLLGAALRASVLALAQHVAASRRAALEAAEGASREALDEETAARAVATGEAMTLEALLEYLGELE
jgi:predicted ATPase